MKANSHGGKRKGAGRKPSGRVQVRVWLLPDVWAKIQSNTTASKTPGMVIEDRF